METDANFLTKEHWQNVGVRHHHGICLHLGSLRTQQSCGIGEYLDLIPLLEWLSSTGFDLIQLLPLQDTGHDPSPYMAKSAYALHPIYLSLRALPRVHQVPGLASLLDELTVLNTTDRVQYHTVLEKKLSAISLYLDHQLHSIEDDPLYQVFIRKHRDWLLPYALFCTLKDQHHGWAWWDWSIDSKSFDLSEHPQAHLEESVRRWQAVQFLCFQQLHKVKTVADNLKMLLKGDIPILLNQDSADVWWHPELFTSTRVAGAPPDMYNKEGQYWGFPLFNWNQHIKEHFAWWKGRLRTQSQFYHIFRLDHIVGFYRLWAIPPGKKPKDGEFVPKLQSEWKKLGEDILKALIESTHMLPIGEDLGDIPELTRTSMHDLGIPGLKVLRWERRWKQDQSFIPPTTFSPESLSTLSTHDSSTICSWWKEEPAASKKMAHDYGLAWKPCLSNSLLTQLLRIAHTSGSLFHVNLFQEYLSLFPELSWNDPSFDRINVPGTISDANWTFRFRSSIEEMSNHLPLASMLRYFSS
jgi:4-alpha-glucanotransferase